MHPEDHPTVRGDDSLSDQRTVIGITAVARPHAEAKRSNLDFESGALDPFREIPRGATYMQPVPSPGYILPFKSLVEMTKLFLVVFTPLPLWERAW